MKKLLSILFVIMAAAMLLQGCSGDKPGEISYKQYTAKPAKDLRVDTVTNTIYTSGAIFITGQKSNLWHQRRYEFVSNTVTDLKFYISAGNYTGLDRDNDKHFVVGEQLYGYVGVSRSIESESNSTTISTGSYKRKEVVSEYPLVDLTVGEKNTYTIYLLFEDSIKRFDKMMNPLSESELPNGFVPHSLETTNDGKVYIQSANAALLDAETLEPAPYAAPVEGALFVSGLGGTHALYMIKDKTIYAVDADASGAFADLHAITEPGEIVTVVPNGDDFCVIVDNGDMCKLIYIKRTSKAAA